MKKIAIIQSNYLPWKGYFDIINDCDIFVFLDNVQYTKNDWRNRNLIKTQKGLDWITVPAGKSISRKINEVYLNDDKWQRKHYMKLRHAYHKCKYFKEYEHLLDNMYLKKKWKSLSELNQYSIKLISNKIGINTKFKNVEDFSISDDRQKRLINIIKQNNGSTYISGQSAKSYINIDLFKKYEIDVIWKDYNNYPKYNQRFPPFVHEVSILDLIFNEGSDSYKYIWGWRNANNSN